MRRLLLPALLALALLVATGCGSSAPETASTPGAWRIVVRDWRPFTDIGSFTFTDDNHGWLVADASAKDDDLPRPSLFGSDDGGRRWSICEGRIVGAPREGAGALPRSVDGLPFPGRVVSVDKTLLLTYYARAPWSPPRPKGIFSSGILTSSDGGETWSPLLSLAPSQDSVVSLVAGDAQHLWALCAQGRPDLVKGAYLLRSEDGGGHWRQSPLGGFGAFGIGLVAAPVVFVDAKHAWSMIGSTANADGFAVHHRTSDDGGRTWNRVTQPSALGAPSLTAVDATHAWSGGGSGSRPQRATLCSTVDGGKTWQAQYFDGGNVPGVYFADLEHGWVVVTKRSGTIIYGTADGGRTWREEYSLPDEAAFQWVFHASDKTLFVSDGCTMLSRPLPAATQ